MNICIADGCAKRTRTSNTCAKHRTYTRPCANCGTIFTTRNKKTLCCSGECGTAHWQNNSPEATCPTCGVVFKTKSAIQLYCSVKCRPLPEPVEQTRTCIQCGASYSTATQRKTCSDECVLAIQNAQSEAQWSDLRRGYETNDHRLFFTALIADCDTGNRTGCWTWSRSRNKFGYAYAKFGEARVYLHRAALEMAEGRPLGVLHAHHKCANASCVNPDHLEPATAADNTLEMLARNSYIARIAELEAALASINPQHEALFRIPTN